MKVQNHLQYAALKAVSSDAELVACINPLRHKQSQCIETLEFLMG